MLTVDDLRVNFHRDYALPREDKLPEFCYRVWIGDLAYEPAGICVWACGKVGIESQQDELLQSAMDELNRLIKEKLEYLKGFVNE